MTKRPGKEFKPWPSNRELDLEETKLALKYLAHFHGAWARYGILTYIFNGLQSFHRRYIRGHRHVSPWRENEDQIEPKSKPEDFDLSPKDLTADQHDNLAKFFFMSLKKPILTIVGMAAEVTAYNQGRSNGDFFFQLPFISRLIILFSVVILRQLWPG